MYYSIALFLHIVGALGLFAALSLEWMSQSQLRRAATGTEVQQWISVFGWLRRIGPASLLALLLAGFYMTATTWGGVAWIIVALTAMLLLFPTLGAFSGSRLGAIGRTVAAEVGPLSVDLRDRLRDPFLVASLYTRTAVFLGIVFLMTVKPDLMGSLFTIGAALIIGLTSALPAWRRSRANEVTA